ncbi:MAG: PQQ-binding-like beta-propeller repeat protein [Pirellulales bacterium]|nr:PQQ-binding-like beta-propeller repeat protein [Pirellulales bacterium]
MTRHPFLVQVAATVAVAVTGLGSSSADSLLTESTAARHGLARPWYTQIRLDPSRNRVTHLRLAPKTDVLPDTLFVQTDAAAVHALDAQTGRTLWVRTIGNPRYPTMPLGANADLIALANGTRLYLVNRADGKILREDRIDGVPAAGTVMSRSHAFVPLINGRVMAYPVTKQKLEAPRAVAPKNGGGQPDASGGEPAAAVPDARDVPAAPDVSTPPENPVEEKNDGSFGLEQKYFPPLTCVSFGRLSTQPILVRDDNLGELLAWSTTRGLFVGRIEPQKVGQFTLTYQLATAREIVSQPTFLPPRDDVVADEGVIFTAAENGEVFATLERHGTRVWSVAIGKPILEPVIPIGPRLYVATQLGGMYCLSAKDGQTQWWTDHVTQFVAASEDRVYAADALGRLVVLDAQSGARLDAIDTSAAPLKFRNLWTDRIYLVTKMGLVQCLHEVEHAEPIRHRAAEPVPPSAKPGAPPGGKAPASNPFEVKEKKPQPSNETDAPTTPDEGDDNNPFA